MMEDKKLYEACQSDDKVEQEEGYRLIEHAIYPVVFLRTRHLRDWHEFAQDCIQQTVERIYDRIADCHTPTSFRAWARRIAINITLNNLKRQSRTLYFSADAEDELVQIEDTTIVSPEIEIENSQFWELLSTQSPMSDRSKRVVIGRFRDQYNDEQLAMKESQLASKPVTPANIQVTRSKNIRKLRIWRPMEAYRGH